MQRKIVIANWKMNGQIDQVKVLINSLKEALNKGANAEVVVLPPFIYLPLVKDLLQESALKWGAQNCYPALKGAFTGEISAPMLIDYDCSYILVGHSERRQLFKEGEIFLKDKFHHVKEHGMIPVLCVGETLEEQQQGLTEEIITKQILSVKSTADTFANCVIAYEPVWAIGTGKTATPEQVQEVHSFIRTLVAKVNVEDAVNLPILYGGSVNEKNAESLFAMPDVDGGLVGGASLNAQQFVEIVKCIK